MKEGCGAGWVLPRVQLQEVQEVREVQAGVLRGLLEVE